MSFLAEEIVHSDGTLPLEEAHDVSDGIFWGNAEKHVNVIGAGIRFDDFDFFLRCKIADDLPNFSACVAIEHFLAVFWYNHNVVLAVPDHMTLRFKGAHSEWRVMLLRSSPSFTVRRDGRTQECLTGRAGGLLRIIKTFEKNIEYYNDNTHQGFVSEMRGYLFTIQSDAAKLEYYRDESKKRGLTTDELKEVNDLKTEINTSIEKGNAMMK